MGTALPFTEILEVNRARSQYITKIGRRKVSADMKFPERLYINVFAVSNKVEDKEFEYEDKTGTGSSLTAILTKNHKNGYKWDFDPPYLENSPRYDIDMCVVFDKVDQEEFESEEKNRKWK